MKRLTQLEKEEEELERQKEELAQKIAKLKAAILALDELPPDLAPLLDDEADPQPTTAVNAESEQAGTHFDRIASFLLAANNFPHTIAQIEEGTGIPRSSISAVLYRTHPHQFTVSDGSPNTGRSKLWRLSESHQATGPVEDDIPF